MDSVTVMCAIIYDYDFIYVSTITIFCYIWAFSAFSINKIIYAKTLAVCTLKLWILCQSYTKPARLLVVASEYH